MHELYMRRALQLARCGEGRTAPNPMVGAVVVAGGRIIGEGYHRTFGGPHAEVNAIASVKEPDRDLLTESTIYVTLEPCSHYGKTPPCAKLIIEKGIPRVVVGAPDPNPLVAGKGIRMLRDSGIEVLENVLLKECLEINKRFMTAKIKKRPWILLKWAESADRFMAAIDKDGNPEPVKFSNPLSTVWMHRERSLNQAILVGNNTLHIDKPRLDLRHWPGHNPEKITLSHNEDLLKLLDCLFEKGIDSLMVEGGPTLLKSFMNLGLYDEIRVESTDFAIGEGLKAPCLPEDLKLENRDSCRGNIISTFRR